MNENADVHLFNSVSENDTCKTLTHFPLQFLFPNTQEQ